MATLPMNKDALATDKLPRFSDMREPQIPRAREREPHGQGQEFASRFSSGTERNDQSPATHVVNLPTTIDRPRNPSLEPYTSRIVFKSRGRVLFLPVSEIRWIGAEENYVRLCMEKESHLLRETMMRIERQLDPRLFLRVHRSAMVNLQFVKEVRTEGQGDFAVHLVSGQRVPMSRSYHARLGNLLTRIPSRIADCVA